jgi:hypothetical protein
MTKNKKAAMEMSVGTIVTIVLLMTVLVLGLVLVRNIFSSATKSVTSIDSQVTTEINNLFTSENKDLVVTLGSGHLADVKQGSESFGFVFGYSPDNPTDLIDGNCRYYIEASSQNTYCAGILGGGSAGANEARGWLLTGFENVEFDEIQKNAGYALVRMSIPEATPICLQRYTVSIKCNGHTTSSTFFDINVVKQGIFK